MQALATQQLEELGGELEEPDEEPGEELKQPGEEADEVTLLSMWSDHHPLPLCVDDYPDVVDLKVEVDSEAEEVELEASWHATKWRQRAFLAATVERSQLALEAANKNLADFDEDPCHDELLRPMELPPLVGLGELSLMADEPEEPWWPLEGPPKEAPPSTVQMRMHSYFEDVWAQRGSLYR